jgi:regulator of replication initiation timing
MAKVNLSSFKKLMTNLERNVKDLSKGAHEVFVENTPERTGNAKRKTRLQGDKIIADYNYSQELDEGYSRKKPKGMTQPTEQWIEDEINRRNKGL